MSIYTINLGQNVYGGVLDVTNGVLTVTHSIIDMGEIDWSYITQYDNPYFEKFINGRKNGTPIATPIYKYVGIRASVTAGRMNNYECSTHGTDSAIYIRDDRYTSASDFKTAVTGKYICYELATPFEVQLTPTEVELLANQVNTIFADSGDINSLVFGGLVNTVLVGRG